MVTKKDTSRPNFDLEAARALITGSGNRFQSKVTNFFRSKGWATLTSPYYVDLSTDKTRELDLVVEKHTSVPIVWQGHPRTIAVRLFIECKYILNGVVFWFEELDWRRTREWIGANTNGVFPPDETFVMFTNQHHYLTRGSHVAKLFESNKGQKTEDADPIFRTINQCLNGFIHNRTRERLIPEPDVVEVFELNYPVIICSNFSQFFRTNTADDPDTTQPQPLDGNFGLEVNYAYINPIGKGVTRQYFLLDVVDFTKIDTFLGALAAEVQVAANMLRRS